MRYRLDLHLHTEASPDSRTTLARAVQEAKRKKIDALAVSDHYHCAAEEVFSHPLRDGVLLIPAVEYSTEIGHLLGLFLQRPCRTANEGSGRVRFSDAAAAIHAAGGLCVLAHPFELTAHSAEEIFSVIAAHADAIDGIEIYNCRATKKRPDANALAAQAADRFAKPLLRTAGSDAHTPREIGGAWVEVEADELTAQALRQALPQPLAYGCGPCRHMALARSQFIRLRKKKMGLRAALRWCAFAALCALRSLKGALKR